MLETLLSLVDAVLIGALGAAALLYGRRYFWLCAGAIGFAASTAIVERLVIAGYSRPILSRDLLIGLLTAILCGAIVWWLPRIAGIVIGFGFGVYGVMALLAVAAVELSLGVVLLLAIAVGAVCARYASWDVDQAIIMFSVLLGASMVVRVLPISLQSALSGIIWLSLLLVGIIYQYSANLATADQAEVIAAQHK